MNLSFSFIIPVYNRPDEIKELLQSLEEQTYSEPFEVLIIEDGSSEPAEQIVKDFEYGFSESKNRIAVTYLKKTELRSR